jgi:hypothetical protein
MRFVIFLLAVIIADSLSMKTIILKEKYGTETVVDSVTLAIEQDNVIYVTRNRDFYGMYPIVNYSLTVR